MVKQRMTTADVAGEVSCLRQRLVGMRLANVYDINPKTYLLKFARSGEHGEKVFVIIESGVRLHTTKVVPDKGATPSNFTLKLRKHLRTRRLESIVQLGVDRLVDLQLGSGEAAHHLLLEFYAQGNLVLTDSKYEVLTLLRSHRDDAKGLQIMPRHPYPIHAVRRYSPLTGPALAQALARAGEGETLRGLLAPLLPYGPAVADHVIVSAGMDPGRQPAAAALDASEAAALLAGVRGWESWLAARDSEPARGFIFTKPAKAGEGGGGAAAGGEGREMYESFEPMVMAQHAARGRPMEFETFDAALEEFFGKIDSQRATAARAAQEAAAVGRVDRVKTDHAGRVAALAREAEAAQEKAALIEYNLEAVDAAIDAVRAALAAGMSWPDLVRMVKQERKAGNPVAGLIDALHLERGAMTLLLSNHLDVDGEDWDEDAATRPATKVEVDLSVNAHANAARFYDAKKKHAAKERKTVDAGGKALKAAQKKADAAIKQVRTVAAVQAVRKPFWFERFHWFVSSEGYVVLSGRDAQQNELLVKRYLRRGDVYVHADLHGAASTVVKNVDPGAPVPPLTLSQAAAACCCRSAAWDAKVVTSAWWVHHDQVSKTAPTGEYLTVGSFVVRGKKNYMPPQPLVMGMGYLFRLEESCIAAHLGERAVRGKDEPDTQAAPAVHEMSSLSLAASEAADSDGGGRDGSAHEASALDRFLDSSVDPLARRGGGGGAEMRLGEQAYERYGLQPGAGTSAAGGDGGPHGAADGSELRQMVGIGESAEQRARLSVHQRKMLKKGGKPTASAPPPQQAEPPPPRAPSGAPPPAGSTRGKSGKAKRAKSKYAEQDEEDRQLALALLQSQGERKDKKTRKAERKARREAVRVGSSAGAAPSAEDIQRLRGPVSLEMPAAADSSSSGGEEDAQAHEAAADASPEAGTGERGSRGEAGAAHVSNGGGGDLSSDAADNRSGGGDSGGVGESGNGSTRAEGNVAAAGTAVDDAANGAAAGAAEYAAADAGDDAAADAADDAAEAQAAAAERAEVAALLAEENVELLDEEDRARLREVDALTGMPRPDDILLHALPMCAPYSALTTFKLKVKLVPGTQRKGKAGRQVVELLSRAPEATPRERELIRAVPEMDNIQAMVGNVKVSMPGLSKLKTEQRKSKKKGAK